MTLDPTSRKSIRVAEKAAKAAEGDRKTVIAALMQHKSGRAYMHNLLAEANIFHSTFNTNALTMAFAEGQRSTGLKLLADLMLFCPDQYILMMREANERDRNTTSQLDRGADGDGGDQEPSSGRDDDETIRVQAARDLAAVYGSSKAN